MENDKAQKGFLSSVFTRFIKQPLIKQFGVLSIALLSVFFLTAGGAWASEADFIVPEFSSSQRSILIIGIVVCFLGSLFGLYQYLQIKKLKAHKSMLDVASIIYETCKIYLFQQGKFITILFVIVAVAMSFYFGYLKSETFGNVILILSWTVIGILGSYAVAWYGIRINTYANSRTAFASLRGEKPLNILNIPLDAGMSIGVILICVELFLMLCILLFVPSKLAGASFIGFAIGESLGASALRIAGGIFTKIADIASDLMKIVFGIREDDPRNPGVIADCTGDNAGDSVGPTADGFETYGVTGVALVTFICLAVGLAFPEATKNLAQTNLLIWIFTIRVIMVITSIGAFYVNRIYNKAIFGNKDQIDFERPLTSLIWFGSVFSIIFTYIVSYLLLGRPSNELYHLENGHTLWYVLATIISCGTLGAALIPELTKVFTSSKSIHVQETVKASREGGASLNILAGLVAGNFSAFWTGMVFTGLMFTAYKFSTIGLSSFMSYPSIFAFGLVAFGFLSMGPITIAVDSYGPVTDNAQSIYELSLIEKLPNIEEDIEKDFGFKPNFEKARYYLESNDSAGNTFKATAKPVLIGTAVVGATIMIFSLILVIKKNLNVDPETLLTLLNPYTILGFILGGAVIYWFTGASIQAVSTGAYRAVEYIKEHIDLSDDADPSASLENSKEVVRICTQYAQKGMLNIFIGIFSFTLAFALLAAPRLTTLEPISLFVSYLLSIAIFGLFQAVFMANAGGCWDNAKKVVEVDLKEANTPLHDAAIVGDTVGDPFKDTSSVALNPIIKFTTLFGLLAMEIAIADKFSAIAPYFGLGFLVIGLYFVYRTFYSMRIGKIIKSVKKKSNG